MANPDESKPAPSEQPLPDQPLDDQQLEAVVGGRRAPGEIVITKSYDKSTSVLDGASVTPPQTTTPPK
jgi:hypothetical protein